jgi:hypothetical protein
VDRISKSVNRPPRRFSPGDAGLRRVTLPDNWCYSNVTTHIGTETQSLRVPGLAQALGPGRFSPGAASNEAGKLLMHKDLGKYVGTSAAVGSLGAPDSWLLAPDFYFADERSRNVIDMKGHLDLFRSKAPKGGRIGTRLRHPVTSKGYTSQVPVTTGKVTVTLGKVPVTSAAGSEIVWWAEMYKGMNSLAGHVAYRHRDD